MSKPRPPDDDLDLMLGYPKPQTTLRDLEYKIDLISRQIERLKNELTSFGIGAIVTMALIYYNK